MKKYCILFVYIFLFSICSFSQDDRLFENEWYLTELTIDGDKKLEPKDTEGLPVKLFFYKQNSADLFRTGVCDSQSGEVNFDSVNPEFTIISASQTLGGCNFFSDHSDIQNDYFNLYSLGKVLTYEFSENLGLLYLTITSVNGDKAIYSEPTPLERIDEGIWVLKELTIDSESILDPLNSRGEPVTTEFGLDMMGNYTFGSWICETSGGEINYISDNNNLFTVDNTASTLGGCEIAPGLNSTEIYNIDNNFFDFFSREDGLYVYVIIKGDNNSSSTKLIIHSESIGYAIYNRVTLSSKDFSKISFSIYPNPVIEELIISSSEYIENYKIEVFDLLGKLRISKSLLDSNSINVKNLSKGMYIVLLKDDFGNKATKKFVKN